MRWDELVAEVHVMAWVGQGGIEVRGVQYDSRRVGAGDVFVAMRGGSLNANRFIKGALTSGAAAVLTDSPEEYAWLALEGRPTALVERGRRALSEVSAAMFGHPERKLAVSAVTGTNGKTTTAWVLEQMLRSAGRASVLVGTIETHVASEVRESPHTTPESRDLLRTFADGVAMGCTEAVIEASSHALEQERVWGIPVDVAIWTNLTQDHLDYHGTMEAYFESKAKLFAGLGTPAPRVAVVNVNDGWGRKILERASGSELVWGYAAEGVGADLKAAQFTAREVRLGSGETWFRLTTPSGETEVRSRLTGLVNVQNLLAAAAGAMARGLTLEQVACASAEIMPVPGRFETVPNQLGLTVVVDYAHTDDALKNLTALARGIAAAGRVITVFGCGGDRDRTKRSKMGRAAGQGSDLVVVTSDNPRTEDPASILDEVIVGVRETAADVIVEEDRAGAIAIALRAARAGDVVLIAGKGHEKVQIFADGAVPFDDALVAAEVLREMGGE